MQTLQCPQCGGQLDPSEARGGVSHCPYCGVSSLMAEGELRTLTSYALAGQHEAEAFRAALIDRLQANGIEEIPEIRLTETTVPFLVRRGHVRITPKPTQSGNEFLAEQHEEVHEGYFGVPLTDEFPLGLYQAADTSAFVEGPEQFPDDLEGALLRFDDRARSELVAAWQKRTTAAHVRFRNWDDRATWADELCTLTLPVAVFSFHYPTKDSWRWAWKDANPEGRYEAAYNLHDGAELRWNVPRKQRNLLVLIIAIFVGIFVVLPLLAAAIGALVALAGAIFWGAG